MGYVGPLDLLLKVYSIHLSNICILHVINGREVAWSLHPCHFLCLSIIHTALSHLFYVCDSHRISHWEDLWYWYPLVLCLSNDLLYLSLFLSLSLPLSLFLPPQGFGYSAKTSIKELQPRIFLSACASCFTGLHELSLDFEFLPFYPLPGLRHTVYSKCSNYTVGAHSYMSTYIMPDYVFMCFFFFLCCMMASLIHLRHTCTPSHIHSYGYMHSMWIVNRGMQTFGASLLSNSQVADTSTPNLPASVLVKWKCPVCFSFGKPPEVEQQGPVNYSLVALDLSMQNQCPFASSLFCAMPVIPPFSACPVAHKSSIWMTTSRGQEELASAFTLW